MKTTGEFVIHRFEIRFKKYGEVINLIPFGDVHYGAPLFAKENWKNFVSRASRLKNAYFFGIGDYMDVVSTSERYSIRSSNLHDSTLSSIDQFIKKQADDFCEEIKFMKGRIIGMVGGNHYYQFETGMTSDHYICEKMGCKYLGVKALVALIIKDACGHHAHRIDICAHHGEGGGRTPGASINKLYRDAQSWDADIILQGHDHERMADFVNRIGLSDGHSNINLVNRRILIARTGSFLKGYVNEHKSYVTDANLPPSDLGAINISLKPFRKTFNKIEERGVEINVTL